MGGRQILVADDDPDTVRLLTKTLQRAGYGVLTALDATQAVMVAHQERPVLILTDVMMPSGGGLSVLDRLKRSTKTNMIPIIVLAASGDSDIEARAWADGAVGFLRKPWSQDVLLGTIRKAVGEEG